MNATHSNPRPAPVSSVLAVTAAVAVLLALAGEGTGVGTWLAVELAGLGAVTLGAVAYRTGYRIVGLPVALVGGVVCAVAIGGFGSQSGPLSELLRLLPGFLGLAVLAAALVPVRGDGSRSLVKLGTGGLFACVVLAGLFRTADVTLLLGTAVGTIVAWDVGEHAIGVGEQLGRRATTWRLEATHAVGTALVGVASVAVVHFARGFANDGLSLASFAMVFVAVVLLTVALRW
ncbi:hypothetical protein NDI85_19020 [Halomicroarcula sp. S1AR25-4]|uniref:DUF7519 family protein n=1 Tax=Haloarcula sp. S1AR25-4 TaxID=2950538 RepID=UPI002874E772|nr:hypothetical protein [Halomicroarcula sp. S1AR25-4]MDS0279879.1 hypothetical protein [Halomicroarcula sp. S1AR25-4]